MRIIAILACAIVTACSGPGGPNLTQVMERCGYEAKPFVAAWPCVRQAATQADLYSDLKGVYIASGDFVVEQVTAGKMTDAEAKLAMAQVRQRAREAADARGNISTGDAIVVSSILNRPNPFASAPPVIAAPSPSLNCYRFGNNVQCY